MTTMNDTPAIALDYVVSRGQAVVKSETVAIRDSLE